MTTATRADDLVAATVPYALFGLAHHLIDHQLPSPLDVEVPGHAGKPITLWIRPEHAAAWTTTAITLDGPTTHSESITGTRHTVRGTIHGPCVPVRILWTVPDLVEHTPCVGDDGTCGQVICACDAADVLGPCVSTVEPGCVHGYDLCESHRGECSECVDDARQDRTAATQ